MLFTNRSAQRISDDPELFRRAELLQRILANFGQTFPNLKFELDAKSQTVNAQAIVRTDGRIVRLYGGLAFHTSIGIDGLVFTLLHETGHHLSSGGRLALNENLGCECAADRWALTKGRSRLEEATGLVFDLDRAVASLEALNATVSSSVETPQGDREGPKICWASSWTRRKHILGGRRLMPTIPRCYLSEYFDSQADLQ